MAGLDAAGQAINHCQPEKSNQPIQREEVMDDDLRVRARRAARWFNDSLHWMPFAVVLTEIKQQHKWLQWSYKSFSSFIEEDLDIRKNTASEVLKAYGYLVLWHPERLKTGSSAAEHIPSYPNLVLLARAAGKLPEGVMEQLDQALFAGAVTRKWLKEKIDKELSQTEPPKQGTALPIPTDDQAAPDTSHAELLDTLQEFYKVVDVEVLAEAVTVVFDDWGADNLTERRQLLVRLQELFEWLQRIGGKLSEGG